MVSEFPYDGYLSSHGDAFCHLNFALNSRVVRGFVNGVH